jgi:1-acyl-sn-glycerol-3-phosphate acyltransferase
MHWLFLAFVILLIFFAPRFLQACENASTADWGSRKVNRIAGFIYLLCKHLHHLQFDPLPLPKTGGALVASNHISGLDPFLLIAASPRPLRFLIAREQYQRFGLNWLFRLARCIPVDREGRPERALREALTALEQGDVVAVFPHGRIHLDSDPPRKLKGGVVRLAQRTDSPIFPVRIDDVRGAGHTVLAVVIPSYSRLRVFPTIDCSVMEHEECLIRLATFIESRGA